MIDSRVTLMHLQSVLFVHLIFADRAKQLSDIPQISKISYLIVMHSRIREFAWC